MDETQDFLNQFLPNETSPTETRLDRGVDCIDWATLEQVFSGFTDAIVKVNPRDKVNIDFGTFVHPNLVVESQSKVGIGSIALRNASRVVTVFGNSVRLNFDSKVSPNSKSREVHAIFLKYLVFA